MQDSGEIRAIHFVEVMANLEWALYNSPDLGQHTHLSALTA